MSDLVNLTQMKKGLERLEEKHGNVCFDIDPEAQEVRPKKLMDELVKASKDNLDLDD